MQRAFDLRIKPPVKRPPQQSAGDDEEEDAGNQRQADESDHQPRLQAGTEHALLALDHELDQVAHHQKDQQPKEDNIDVDQKKENDVAAQGIFRRDVG